VNVYDVDAFVSQMCFEVICVSESTILSAISLGVFKARVCQVFLAFVITYGTWLLVFSTQLYFTLVCFCVRSNDDSKCIEIIILLIYVQMV
jgi:hypothetical protein